MDGLDRLLESMQRKEQEGDRMKEPECLLILDGTPFMMDVTNEWIYELANPANYIPLSALEERDRQFQLVYDPVTKNIFKGEEEEQLNRFDLAYITLHQLKWMPAFGFVWTNPKENVYKMHR
jgi:hypothetical protein